MTVETVSDGFEPWLHCRDGWLLPVLQPLVPHMLQRLTVAWSTVLSNQALRPAHQEGDPTVSATAEDSEAANDDVVMERLLRELTREHLTLLVQLQEQRPASGGGGGTSCLVQRICCLGGRKPCRLCRPRKGCWAWWRWWGRAPQLSALRGCCAAAGTEGGPMGLNEAEVLSCLLQGDAILVAI